MILPGRRGVRSAGVLVLSAVLAAAVAGALLLFGASARSTSARQLPGGHSDSAALQVTLPSPLKPSFVPPTPLRLSERETARWAVVQSPVAARAQPTLDAPVVTRLGRLTPEGTSNLVLVLGTQARGSGGVWVRARLPVLPNGTTGWVPRSALGGYQFVHTHLVIDLERPTPRGEFYIRNKLVSYRSPSYGPFAFGTSARSVLTDWPAGGFIGIHGTDRPDLLPGRVSHGCIRLRNSDIVGLARLMPIGTPLTIK
jgi:L,D-transpeptidase catalytic domain